MYLFCPLSCVLVFTGDSERIAFYVDVLEVESCEYTVNTGSSKGSTLCKALRLENTSPDVSLVFSRPLENGDLVFQGGGYACLC